MDIQPNAQGKKFNLTPLSPKDFELAPVTAEAFMPENLGGIAPEQTGIGEVEALKQNALKTKQSLLTARQKLEEDYSRQYKPPKVSYMQPGGQGTYNFESPDQSDAFYKLQDSREKLDLAVRYLDRALNTPEAKKGAGKAAFQNELHNIISAGISGMLEDLTTARAAKQLTKGQVDDVNESLVNAYGQLENLNAIANKEVPRYRRASGIAGSLPYMEQFLLTGGVGTTAGGVAKSAAQTITKGIASKAVKGLARRAVQYPLEGAISMIGRVPLSPATYGNIAQESIGQLKEVDGQYYVDPDTTPTIGQAIAKGTYNSAKEIFSESLGGMINVPASLFPQALNKAISPSVRQFFKMVGMNNPQGEYFEEMVSQALGGENPLDPEFLKDLAVTIPVITGGFSALSLPSVASQMKINYDKKKVVDVFGWDTVNEIYDLVQAGDSEAIGVRLYEMQNPQADWKDYDNLVKYAASLVQEKAAEEMANQPDPVDVLMQDDSDPDAPIKAEINQYGEKLKFNSNIPLAEDQNPLISIASHKIEDKKFFLTGESGAIGDHVFTAYDFDALQEAGYDLTQVRPQLIKASDIRERMDIPYQEWLQQEVNQFKQAQVQGQQMVVKAQAPVQEGQEVTLKDKVFVVTAVDETGVTLNEMDKDGNITGATLPIPPEDYEKVFGAPAVQSGQISPDYGQISPENVTDQGQIIPDQASNTGQPVENIPEQVQLPINKKGEIEYDQITEPAMYAQGLTEEFGEEAPAILDELIAEQTQALEKAKKGSNAIERARKVKAINAELKKLSGVKEILAPTAIAEGQSLEAPSASPVVEQPELETQATEQELARPEEEEPVVSEMEQTEETEEEAQQPATEPSPEVELTKANAQVDTRPTEAQKEAGNYQKGHLKLHGLDISIENPVGSIRKGTDKKGNDWAILLNNSYGYIRRTVSPEGEDQVDVFLGDNLDSDSVYVIDQIDPDSGKFDEHKVMMGFNSAQDAKDNYLANYEPGWKGLGDITKMSIETFKQWVFDKEATQKPLAYKEAAEEQREDQETGPKADNTASQTEEDTTAGSDQAGKEGTGGEVEFAGASLENTPRTRSLREFTKGDHVKNIKTGNEYVVMSVPKTGDISLKKLKGKEIQNFNGKSAQWIPIQREIKTKGAKRTVKFSPDSKTGKLLAKMPQNFKEFVLQFFIGGGRVSHADFFRYVGWKAGRQEGYIWAVKGSADGKGEQGKAFDSFWEGTPEEWGRNGGTEDIEEIVDVLKSYPSIAKMMDELKRLQSSDESVPDRNMPSPEELGAAVSDADIEDDLANHEDEIIGSHDDIWDNPDYQIIFDKYSNDKGLDVDKLLADINDNPEEISTLTPFGLNDKELNTLKKYLEDEQSRRKESQGTESIQGLDQDKGQSGEKDSSGSGQGDTVRSGSKEGERNEVTPPKDDIDKINDILDKPAEPKKGPSYSPIQQKQIDKINKEYSELIAKKEAAIVQAEKDMREALLKADNRNGLFGDVNPVEKDEIIKRDEQGFTYNEATRAAVRKPFEEKMAELRKEIEELRLEQKGKIESVVKQQDLFADIPVEPAESKPIDKESLPKHEDFGKRLGFPPDFINDKPSTPNTVADLFSNILNSLSFGKKSFDQISVNDRRMMQESMLRAVKNFQVREIIISLVPVDVMDNLIGPKFSTYVFLHDPSMFMDSFSPQADLSVPTTSFFDSIGRGLADNRTISILSRFGFRRDGQKILTTDATNNGNLFGETGAITGNRTEIKLTKQESVVLNKKVFTAKEAFDQYLFDLGGVPTLSGAEVPSGTNFSWDEIETLSASGTINNTHNKKNIDDVSKIIHNTNISNNIIPGEWGQKIGGARKDMEITRKVRDTDSLPAWRRKYHYANADGTLNLGAPVDTSKPFIVQWSKEIASWGGKRTVYRPVTTIDTRETKIFNSEEEAEAYIPIYEVWNQHFRVRKSGDNYVITKTSSTNKVVEYATFPTEEEANTYMYSTEGATSLLNHKREDFSIPALDKVERTGKDWRKGKDISTEEFMETFGFRGGEFGNWVKPEERRVMLNAAYDSFMDMAELLGVPPRSLSLSGELSIAFGARGVKGAAAHFEPDRAVINLTRMNGAGSLAHEWAHALDNYFGLQAAKKDYSRNDKGEVKAGKVMRTEAGLLAIQGMRKALSEKFDKIIEATQEKSVTRKMGIDEKQLAFDKFQKSVKREADDLIKKFTNGVRRYQYNRKTKQREDVVIKATPEQIKKAKVLVDKITTGQGTKPTWDRIPGSKSRFGDYSYISPETLALDGLYKEVFGHSGLKRDGNGFYNLGYYGDRMYRAKETLDKALAGESETLTVPTDFLKESKWFDKSRANPYWGTKVEMFARAFEYFIETKLQDQNVRADYLQYDKAPVYDAVYGKNPYPAGEERAEINKLFQQFFDEVKVKTDENNVTSLYEKAEEYIRENKVYSQARPLQDFPEGVSYLSERSGGSLSGQLDLFGESDYTPTTDDGNVTYVERLISERGVTFLGDKLTGPPTIRTSADIAFLFKNLESATSENAFAVLISETGEYKVLYLGTGGTTGVIIDSKLIIAAAKEFGAKRVVVVHNHPSGNLKPSGADMAFDRNIMTALESMDIDLDPSIIIDLDSGEFTVFAGENVDYKKYRKEDYGTDVPVEDKTIYQFEKKKLYVPASERTAVKNSADIAEYLSKMKRGTTPKLHVIILDRSLHINKYLLYDETISNEELISGLLYEVGKHGEMVALASNTRMSPGLLVDLAAKLKKVDSDIIDFIQIKQGDDILNNYISYGDEGLISEPKVPYGKESSMPEFAGEYLEGAQDITQTPAFKKWFGNSKVVDENGKPLVVYHGTRSNFDVFKPSGKQGNQKEPDQVEGMYFTDNQAGASFFSSNSDDPQYLKAVYLSIQNPYITEGVKSLKESLEIDKLGDVAEKLKSMGYDGLIMEKGFYAYGGPHKQIIAFSPTQIKSATGNSGTFDTNNPNILKEPQDNYRFAGDWLEEQPEVGPNPELLKSAAQIYAERQAKGNISETVQGIREYIQDMNLPVRKFEEDVLKRGGQQDNNSKPYRDMNLSFGRQEKLYTDYFDKKMKPIFKAIAAIKKAGVKGEEILPYVIAKHAIERNPIMRGEALRAWVDGHQDATADEIDAKRAELKDLDYSGVKSFDSKNEYTNPDELARDIAKAFESTIDKSLIDNFWNSVRTATSATLDTWEAGNQISAEQKKKYLEQYRFFVPLRGWRHGAAKELIYTRGEGFSKSLQKAEGRKSLADNPLAYILSVQFQAIAEQVDNEVKTSMYNLILKNLKNPEINELATIKKLYYVKIKHSDGTEEWEPAEQRPDQELFASGEAKTKIYREHERLRKFRQAKEHEVIVHRPGGDMIIVFKKNQLSTAHALNKQNYIYRTVFGNIYDARDVNKALTLLGSMNNTLKALYTSWNVVFPFTNFMRDFQEASITQSIKQGTGLKVMANYKGAFPAVFRNLIGKPNLNSQMDRDLQDFYSLGGATGYTHTKTIEDIEKDVNREVERLVGKGTVLGSMKNGFRGTMGAVEAWNKVFEDATRFSVYLSSLAAGNSKQDAAMDAKEASVNFNRKGKGSKAWDSWFAFFNVALQSLQKNFKLAKDHTGKFTAVAGSFVMLGFLEALMNALTDDDDKDSAYYNINPWMRQNYLIIPNLPKILTTGEKGNKYLSIPLPQFWRGFKSIGAIAFDIATKKMTIGDGVMAALGNFGSGLLPVDIGGFYKSGEFSWAPVFPTVLKPIVEVAENKNYMGYAIKNEPFTREQKKDLANAGLGKTNVNPAAKYLTDMLFRWGGGKGKYKYYYDQEKGERRNVPGVLDINPSAIEHVFKGYTGGTGAGLSDLLTTVIQATSPEQDIDFKNVPFVNRFIRTVPEAKWNIISEYYNLRDDERANSKLEKEAVKDAETTGDWSTVTAMYGNEYLQRYQETFASFEIELDDAMKMKDFDIVEGNRLSVEIMERAIAEIKELKREYGKK